MRQTLIFLQINNTAQLLNTIQQQISLLNHLLIPGILPIGPIRFHDTSKLINLGSQPSSGNETAQLYVQELGTNTKALGHTLERNGLVRIEELLEGQDV